MIQQLYSARAAGEALGRSSRTIRRRAAALNIGCRVPALVLLPSELDQLRASFKAAANGGKFQPGNELWRLRQHGKLTAKAR